MRRQPAARVPGALVQRWIARHAPQLEGRVERRSPAPARAGSPVPPTGPASRRAVARSGHQSPRHGADERPERQRRCHDSHADAADLASEARVNERLELLRLGAAGTGVHGRAPAAQAARASTYTAPTRGGRATTRRSGGGSFNAARLCSPVSVRSRVRARAVAGPGSRGAKRAERSAMLRPSAWMASRGELAARAERPGHDRRRRCGTRTDARRRRGSGRRSTAAGTPPARAPGPPAVARLARWQPAAVRTPWRTSSSSTAVGYGSRPVTAKWQQRAWRAPGSLPRTAGPALQQRVDLGVDGLELDAQGRLGPAGRSGSGHTRRA